MSGVDPGLFDFLKVRRLALAKEKSIPPYAIFQDRTLIELARIRPSTVEGFRKIHGIGEAKSSHYGEYFVNLIRKYCREVEQLPLDVVPQPAPAIPPTTAPRTPRNLDVAAEEAHRRLREGGQIEEVAAATSRAVSTVEGYLCDVLMDGCLTDASPWVEPALIPRIEELLETSEDNRLKPIYVALGEKVPYWKIRAVAICRRNRTLSKT
jgi:ATP-dependent DNA helicase RecQ